MATDKPKKEAHQSRHRSPNYPAVGLRDAVQRIRKLIEADGKAGSLPDVAAKHIGFSSAHGTARSVLSALRKFGLAAEQRGRIVPTPLAIEIAHYPENSERHKAALRTAALGPVIYKKLVDEYGTLGNLPSDESLRPELIVRGEFNPKAVDAFIADFRDSLTYAGLLEGNQLLLTDGDDVSGVSERSGTWSEPEPQRPFDRSAKANTAPAHQPANSPAPTGMRDLTIPLMGSEMAYLRCPGQMTEENYDYMLDQIRLWKRGLVQKQGTDPIPSSPLYPTVRESGVTPDLRRRLLAHGLEPAEIADMTADEARDFLNASE